MSLKFVDFNLESILLTIVDLNRYSSYPKANPLYEYAVKVS